jgi:hypothetical protein
MQKTGLALLIFTVAGLYVWQDVFLIRDALTRPAQAGLPVETMEWVRTQTNPDAFFMTPNSPMLTLYTGRHAISLVGGAQDLDDFRYAMLQRKMTHVMIAPVSFLYVRTVQGRDPQTAWRRLSQEIPEAPDGFEFAYQNATEPYRIYRVKPSAEFQRAYTLYRQSMDRLRRGETVSVFPQLETSIRTYPLAPALNAYAVDALLSGRNLTVARDRLHKALKIRPLFPMALVNLARVSQRLKDRVHAKTYYDQAQQLIERTGDSLYLLPVIERERQELVP